MNVENKKLWIFLLALLIPCIIVIAAQYISIHILKKSIEAIPKNEINENDKLEPFFFTEEPNFTSEFPGALEVINYAKANNFRDLYTRLISGLDKESVDTVNRILTRFEQIEAGDKPQFTTTELSQLNSLRRNFKILKLDDNFFVWKNYFLPINHFEASVFFYQNGITNIENIEFLKNKDIIDVGGFIGDSALIFSNYTEKKVYSFEPSSKNFELMKKTIAMNSKSNIVPVKLGLGSKNQNAKIPLEIGSSLKTDQTENHNFANEPYETIKITTLDQYAEENNLDIGLIKVDIEGNEQDFLKGAENTIKQYRPYLLLSIYHNPSDFFNIKPIIESWGLNYKFKIVKCTDGQICAETLLVASPK